MLVEIEQKVVALSELSVHNENLLMEGKAHTKDEAEQLAVKLRTLKGSLQELQRALHDKQLNIQVRDPAATYGHCPHWAYLFGHGRNIHASLGTCFTPSTAASVWIHTLTRV